MDKQSTDKYCTNTIIYIPTMTGRLNNNTSSMDYVLYSPTRKFCKVFKANKITIWDNHTFFLYKKYCKPDKEIKAFYHYLWLIQFITENYQKDLILITPDTDWLSKKFRSIIEQKWINCCSQYPQLYVPNTWSSKTNGLNIVGYALRNNSPLIINKEWTHCLGHIRKDIDTKLLTYDAYKILH